MEIVASAVEEPSTLQPSDHEGQQAFREPPTTPENRHLEHALSIVLPEATSSSTTPTEQFGHTTSACSTPTNMSGFRITPFAGRVGWQDCSHDVRVWIIYALCYHGMNFRQAMAWLGHCGNDKVVNEFIDVYQWVMVEEGGHRLLKISTRDVAKAKTYLADLSFVDHVSVSETYLCGLLELWPGLHLILMLLFIFGIRCILQIHANTAETINIRTLSFENLQGILHALDEIGDGWYQYTWGMLDLGDLSTQRCQKDTRPPARQPSRFQKSAIVEPASCRQIFNPLHVDEFMGFKSNSAWDISSVALEPTYLQQGHVVGTEKRSWTHGCSMQTCTKSNRTTDKHSSTKIFQSSKKRKIDLISTATSLPCPTNDDAGPASGQEPQIHRLTYDRAEMEILRCCNVNGRADV